MDKEPSEVNINMKISSYEIVHSLSFIDKNIISLYFFIFKGHDV